MHNKIWQSEFPPFSVPSFVFLFFFSLFFATDSFSLSLASQMIYLCLFSFANFSLSPFLLLRLFYLHFALTFSFIFHALFPLLCLCPPILLCHSLSFSFLIVVGAAVVYWFNFCRLHTVDGEFSPLPAFRWPIMLKQAPNANSIVHPQRSGHIEARWICSLTGC